MSDLSGGAQGEGGLPVWWVCGPQIAGIKRRQRSKGILSLIYWKSCYEKDFMCSTFSSEVDIRAWTHTEACRAIRRTYTLAHTLTPTVCLVWTFIDHWPQKWYIHVHIHTSEIKNRHEHQYWKVVNGLKQVRDWRTQQETGGSWTHWSETELFWKDPPYWCFFFLPVSCRVWVCASVSM